MKLRWHPNSNVFDASGAQINHAKFGAVLPDDMVSIPDTPAAECLTQIYTAGQANNGFCLHPAGRPPLHPMPQSSIPMVCCLTSGTSGTPKMILRSQQTWLSSIAVNQSLFNIGPNDRYVVLGALSHSLSLYAAAEALQVGADLYLFAGLRPDRQMMQLAKINATVLYATPAQLRQIVAQPIQEYSDTLRLILVGGSKLDAETRDMLQIIAPRANIHEFYGASETSFIALSDGTTPSESVGRAYPGVTITIRDPFGNDAQHGQVGEIWVESPYLFDGYVALSEDDTRRSGAALTVGEYGHLDKEGYLYLAGRKGRMVTIADQNVFPEEIETCLLDLPQISRVAVLPIPDKKRGNRLVAYIETCAEISDDVILRHCRQSLGTLKSPQSIHRPDHFPTLASGKPDLLALSALVEEMTT